MQALAGATCILNREGRNATCHFAQIYLFLDFDGATLYWWFDESHLCRSTSFSWSKGLELELKLTWSAFLTYEWEKLDKVWSCLKMHQWGGLPCFHQKMNPHFTLYQQHVFDSGCPVFNLVRIMVLISFTENEKLVLIILLRKRM